MGCQNIQDLCLIRGDDFALDVGLSAEFTEVLATPTDYQGRMVIRDAQNDDLPDNLVTTVAIDVTPAPVLMDQQPMYMRFRISPALTQNLPYWDQKYYIELRTISGSSVQRLFQGPLDVHD